MYVFFICVGLSFVLEGEMRKITGIYMQKRNYWETFLGWEMYKYVWKSRMVDITRKARNGLEAQNVSLVTTDGRKCVRLLDLLQADRALVVYFGSCTCPVFMNKLKEFGELAQDYSDIVDFVVVYIEEAHPEDGWSFKVWDFISTEFALTSVKIMREFLSMSHICDKKRSKLKIAFNCFSFIL